MAGEVAEFPGQDIEDGRVDLDAGDALRPEIKGGQDIPAAADADDGHIRGRLHEIGRVDDVLAEIGELAEVAVHPGDDGRRIGVDVEIVLVHRGLRRMRHAPAERRAHPERLHADA